MIIYFFDYITPVSQAQIPTPDLKIAYNNNRNDVKEKYATYGQDYFTGAGFIIADAGLYDFALSGGGMKEKWL
ncbi:hypothetical protein [Paremcibacter congregatus]|uniref:hypothetical protein n=1 Tax=Paremcibacter congregatus TaxID=2043170 RepID=UPI0010558039|nr:hypothetical protein [Paremcibacter congregatus]QDE26426.1 hypothetical protein FIV45_03615 [Paremcibacter congregatus]